MGSGPVRAGRRLQNMEHREAHGLLDLGVPLDLDVYRRPELVQELMLGAAQAFPTGVHARLKRPADLVVEGRARARRRPAIGEELVERRHFPGSSGRAP